MSLADSVRDRRALLLRLIVAELLARPGEGPLAPRLRPVPRGARPEPSVRDKDEEPRS